MARADCQPGSEPSDLGHGQSQQEHRGKTGERVAERGLAVFRGIRLSDDDLLRRDVITRLMCHFVLPKNEIEAEYGIVFDDTFDDSLTALAPLEADGLVSLRPDRIEVTPLGRLLIRNIAMTFDAYIEKPGSEANRYSRTV